MKDKILITGCAGFIGFHVAKYFCDKGFSVIGIDNINSYYSQDLKNKRLNILNKNSCFDFVKNDILNLEVIHKIFQKKRASNKNLIYSFFGEKARPLQRMENSNKNYRAISK